MTNIEAGRQKPPLHLLYRMCAALDVEVSSIVPSNEEVSGQVTLPFGSIYGDNDELPPELSEILKGMSE